MADSDTEYDEFFTDMKGEEYQFQTVDSNTSNTSNSSNTSQRGNLYPFSVRLNPQYLEIIKAVAWWERISQRELIEKALRQYLGDNIDSEELDNILTKYGDNN